MKNAIDALIKIYERRLQVLDADVEEIHERMADDFDISDWAGGNFDDAYAIGDRHGRLFEEYSLLQSVVSELKNIREEDE